MAKCTLFAIVAVIVLPLLGDLANGYLKPYDGCRVIGIVDGGTVRMVCDHGGSRTGRLAGVDSPRLSGDCLAEKVQAWAATNHLRWMLWRAGHVSVSFRGADAFGYPLIVLVLDGQSVARPMVEAGLGRWYDGGRRAGWCD